MRPAVLERYASLRQPRKRDFAAGEHQLACPRLVQAAALAALSGDTDAMWLDRCGEDAERPFFHSLTEH